MTVTLFPVNMLNFKETASEYYDDQLSAVKCVGPCKRLWLGGLGTPGDPMLSTTYEDSPFPHFVCSDCSQENK